MLHLDTSPCTRTHAAPNAAPHTAPGTCPAGSTSPGTLVLDTAQASWSLPVQEIVRIRRDIHAHPELAFEEHRTAGLVAQLLQAWGLEVHRGLAQTGVVGVLHCGTSPRSIALRADMDALPLQEHNTFAHASTCAGKMHACGHDGHTAMLLGAAQQLAGLVRDAARHNAEPAADTETEATPRPTTEPTTEPIAGQGTRPPYAAVQPVQIADTVDTPDTQLTPTQPGHAALPFDGTVYFIFQPAEESGGGAQVMMDEGLFERFPADAVYGLHNWPGLPAGDVAVSAGPVMASSNEFSITLHGQGGHAAMPHLAVDPIPVACQLVQAFQTIVSRNTRPLDAAVVSVTVLRAGDTSNIIPNSCTLQGTVRTFSIDVLDMVQRRMEELTQHLCSAFGLRAEFDFQREYPPTINHAEHAEHVRHIARQVLGAGRVHVQEPTMGAEDFGFMLQRKPGCYFFLGNGEGGHRTSGHGLGPCQLHNPNYDFNDQLIPTGIALWTALVQHQLPSTGGQ